MSRVYTGIDIIEIDRIKESIEKEGFLEKIFTDKEIELCTRKNKAEFFAGRFAAKEAIYKALSYRIPVEKVDWKDVEVLSDEKGRPRINFINGSLKRFENKMDVSISHNRTMSTAVAVLILS